MRFWDLIESLTIEAKSIPSQDVNEPYIVYSSINDSEELRYMMIIRYFNYKSLAKVTISHQIACFRTKFLAWPITFSHQILLRFRTKIQDWPITFRTKFYYVFAPILLHFGIKND